MGYRADNFSDNLNELLKFFIGDLWNLGGCTMRDKKTI
jgi:hypothetical protein